MKIEMEKIKIRDVFNGYIESEETGVVGYGGKLNIRPAFQREFVYKGDKRDEVIRSVLKNFPLNVMYWSVNGDGTFEMLDGQQRTISICRYVNNDFSLDGSYFHSLTESEQKDFLDYELNVYFCDGTDREKLNWFEIINIAGEVLTKQERLNAIYAGPWLSEMRRYFSKTNCTAYMIASDYMKGTPIKQHYLETVLQWLCDRDGVATIEEYMSAHQHDMHCTQQKLYFKSVIDWVKETFLNVSSNRKALMKGLPWGLFYNAYHSNIYDPDELERQICALLLDDDVSKKDGVYEYLLSGRAKEKEKCLSIRKFPDGMKQRVYEKQKGICPKCGNHFELSQMDADHITPWSQGGHTTEDNCQMLCKDCNRRKSNK